MKPSKYRTPEERWEMQSVARPSGCREWTGWKDADGYGRMVLNGRSETAQRAAYLIFRGEIAEGHDVHHSCLNPSCVNPDHLETVPKADHLRQHEPGEHNRRKTHCRNGHAYSPENTRVNRDGSRACKTCERDHLKRWRAENHSRYIENKRLYEAEHRAPAVPQTHCKHGHEFTPENTYINATAGARCCRACQRRNAACAYQKNIAARKAERDARRQRQRAAGEKVA